MIPERRLTARTKLREAVNTMNCELPDDDSPIVQTFNAAYREYVLGDKPITYLRRAFQVFRDAVFDVEREKWRKELNTE